MDGIDVPYQSFQVEPAAAKTITLASGTTLNIPENAFVYANGEPVTEPVEIQFREFHNASEIIASGIPMSVQTDHGKDWMQTAGMFEIQGKTATQKVQIAPEKNITVDLHTEVDGKYDYWVLNEETQNWEDIGDSEAVAKDVPTTGTKKSGKLTSEPMTKPTAPLKFNPAKGVIDLEMDKSAFPELADKKGILWQYAGNNPAEDPSTNEAMLNDEFESIELTKNTKGQYVAVFTGEENTYNIPIKMVQRGADYEAAFAQYQTEMKAYRAALAQQKDVLAQQQDLFRTLIVPNFGFYNCDLIYRMKEPIKMMAHFNFGDMPNVLENAVTVYHITGDRRTVMTYTPQERDRFFFDPTADNFLFAVLPGNKVATFSDADFKENLADLKQANSDNPYEFDMDVQGEPVESVADVAAALFL